MKTSFKKSPLAVAIATLFAVLACEPARAVAYLVDESQESASGQTFDSALNTGTVRITNGGELNASDLIINNSGNASTSYGIYVDKGGRLIGSGLYVTTATAAGIRIATGASGKLTNSHIENGLQVMDAGSTLDIRDSTVNGSISVTSQGQAKADNVRVTATSSNGAALSVASGSKFTVSNSSLSANGTNAVGINAQGATPTGVNSKVIADQMTIDVSSVNDGTRFGSHGVLARLGGVVELSNSTVQTRGDANNGLSATGSTPSTPTPATITATNVLVNTRGVAAHGLTIDSGAQINLIDSTVGVFGQDAHGLLVSGKNLFGTASDAVNSVNLTNTTMEVQQASVIHADGGRLALQMNGGQLLSSRGVLLDAENGSTVQLSSENGSQLFGDIRADATSQVDLSLSHNSQLTGAVQHGNAFMVADGAVWSVTGNSDVNTLYLNGGGVHFAAGEAFKTLTVKSEISGSGQFFMNTDLAANAGDLLVVEGRTNGNYQLIVADSGREPGAPGQQLKLVDTQGGAGQFSLYGDHVDAGAFRYTLELQDEDWYLQNTSQVPTTPGGSLTANPESLSTGANAAVANVAATATLWSAEMNALNKRLGELRMGDDEGGLWVRGINKRYEFGEHSSRAFDQDVTGMEIGADGAVALSGGKLFIGGMVGMAQSDNDFGEGASGTTDSKLLGTYATYLHDSGWYVDGVVKYNRFDHQLKTTSNMGQQVKSNYEADGVGADVEVGKHIKLQDGWFVEPQLEVTATHTTSDAYQASNGLRVKPGDVDSLQSRVGTLMGRNLKLSTGQEVQPYAKVSYVTEHGNDSEVNVNGHRLDSALPGSRTEVGGGVVLQVSAKQKVYLDVEHASGDDFEEPWAVNLGYRYLW